MKDDQPSYTEKTERLKAWVQIVKSITPYIWLLVILVVFIPLIGQFFITRSISQNIPQKNLPKTEIVSITPLKQSNLDQALLEALQNAETTAKNSASKELDDWMDELTERVDTSFLPWYFDYFNQKKIEFTAPITWMTSVVTHWIDTNNPSPSQAVAEKLTQDFQTEFAKRVLRPQVEQLKQERMTKETTQIYIDELKNNLAQVQIKYAIPQVEWERYLEGISLTIADTEGNLSNLSMKLLVGGSTYFLAKAIVPVAVKLGSKVMAKIAVKGSAKLAAKTGGAVAGELGFLPFLDPIVGVGIIIWDVWDYNHTVQVEKPILRAAILDYLQEIKVALLDDNILSAIHQIEESLIKSI
ncbi:hypothetical protein [Chroococcus sp. FPU101]|uniref:hypothetical protein n=1 Tax=Chroococcus sp. FPU101 TaxID=1974212 RepID=UPI001A8F0033|nr:hypothetical protein [Chroococcus sp. FPU101]GFE68256.1 hypothetical protein CFPU101_08660 [Chroococcus sp. FPU101]